MSIYPVFSIESINAWCEKDVAGFIAQETSKNSSLNLETGFTLTTKGLINKVDFEKAIAPFVNFIDLNLKGEPYVVSISGITDATLQNKLWIARTFLFSQLMIFAVVILGKNEPTRKKIYRRERYDPNSLYTQVFGKANGKTVFSFMPISSAELELYQMGIFGSKTPTSDIDVGIQYIGTNATPTLHYILSTFENLFLIFTKKSSLDFDIEPYADLYLIRDKSGADYFYLDTGNFQQEDFVRILPVAGLSIARNVLMDDPNSTQPTFGKIVEVVNIDSKFNFEDIIEQELLQVLAEPESTWLSNSMTEMQKFLNDTGDGRRARYYAAVLAAETKKNQLAPNVNQAKELTKFQRCDLINLVGTALAYRMESYTAAPTITHVVRILQANTQNVKKYNTQTPIELCGDPLEKIKNPAYCAIGKYGFVMSILEQIGYMFRFYKHYCVGNHVDKEKCLKKMKKYGYRYLDAFEKYKKHVSTTGGYNRRTRRRNKNRKTLKSRKYRNSGKKQK